LTAQFVVGLLGAPFGLEGYIKVRSLSGETGHIARLKQLALRQGAQARSFEVEGIDEKGDSLLIKLKGIDSPEAA
jgi:16S rRNA processing protein RimM